MRRAHAEESAEIDAPNDVVYGIFADYRDQHPRILPQRYFKRLDVEQGGTGAGTVFRVVTRALGAERVLRMAVTEPEPGRVLAETDVDTGLVTTFTVAPLDGGRARVTIATDWQPTRTLASLLESLLTPPILRRIYRAELRQVQAYVQGKAARIAPS